MKDGAGHEIGRLGFKKNSGDGDPQSEGDKSPLHWQTKLPDTLAIKSEAAGHPRDYIQFDIGRQSWKTSDPDTGIPGCKVRGWSSHFSPSVSLSILKTYLRHELMDETASYDGLFFQMLSRQFELDG